MLRQFSIRFGWFFGGLLFLAACHDAPRKNPFDPELTPAVELSVALDDTAGTATLNWTPYAGEQPFAAYWVLRNVVKSTEVDTLARLAAVEQTTFVDRFLVSDTAYEYRVAVVNRSGFEVDSAQQRIDGYTTRAVRLLLLESRPEAGTMHLAWTRYRDPDFAGYQVRRRAITTDQVEELTIITDPNDTTFTDNTLRADVDYAYIVVVMAAGQELVSNSLDNQLNLPPVQIRRSDFNSSTATATIEWTPYKGPRFRAYQVQQRTAELASQIVAELEEVTVTSFADSGLVGNTEYFYQVAVVTDRGEEIPSEEVSGSIHPLLATWPLEVEAEDYVRLYAEEEDRITALVASPGQVWLLFFDEGGALLEEQELVTLPSKRLGQIITSYFPEV